MLLLCGLLAMLLSPEANGFFRIVLRLVLRTSRMSFSQKRLRSGLEVYGEATSLIFNTTMAVMKMQITLTMVSNPDTIPLIKNSVGM